MDGASPWEVLTPFPALLVSGACKFIAYFSLSLTPTPLRSGQGGVPGLR